MFEAGFPPTPLSRVSFRCDRGGRADGSTGRKPPSTGRRDRAGAGTAGEGCEGVPALSDFLRALAVVAVLGAAGAWLLLHRFESAPGPAPAERVVVVPPGQGLGPIARRLAAEGVIANPHLFVLGVTLRGETKSLQAGEYAFPAGAAMGEVAGRMVRGETLVRQLTVPEGETSARVAARIRAAEGLEGALAAPPAEGTLLPETYFYRRGETREAMAGRMREAMRQALRDAWERRAPDLPLAGPEEVLILASIIEKETGVPEERARVGAVFVNRLRKRMRLQSDPTVRYGLEREDPAAAARALTGADLARKHPWNTYRIRGLPPSPIANPGRASILAAVRPAESDDLYFVADGTGGHAFAATLAEHNRNVARWRALRDRAEEEGGEAAPEE